MLVVLCVIMESGRDVTVLFLLNNFGHLQKWFFWILHKFVYRVR